MTEKQKLREALQAIADWGSHDVMLGVDFGSNGVRDFYRRLALEALALPTADHLPDARVMIETAEPVGERERFEAYFAWSRKSKGANRRPNFERFEEDGTYKDDHTQRHWWTWQQALSAGDAVDAQRLDFIEKSARCDPKMDGQHVWWPTSLNKALKGPTLRDAIDAAMRKGQL